MAIEVALTTITLVIAVIGTLLKDPSRGTKAFLIMLAILSSGASVVKAWNDDTSKKFLETILVASLSPSNSEYEKLCEDIVAAAKTLTFKDADCYHSSDGVAAFLLDEPNGRHVATAVLNRSEIAEMYAQRLRKSSNRKLVLEVMHKSYDPKVFNEEFMDKVGVLAVQVYFATFDEAASNYSYSGKGVALAFDKGGKKQTVTISSEELAKLSETKLLDLFHRVAEVFQAKFAALARQEQSAPHAAKKVQ